MPATWIVVGASRGIGLELVRQLLITGDQVIAAVRNPTTANQLWQLVGAQTRPGSCVIEECDVTNERSIDTFVGKMKTLVGKGMRMDGLILNAGVLNYPNVSKSIPQTEKVADKVLQRATEITFTEFALHLYTNTIGPIIIAQKLLNICTTTSLTKIVFISSDSGSTAMFRDHEDGFGGYAASKAALNQMLRHLAAELKRKGKPFSDSCVLAMHPGEVQTDMSKIDLDWEVEGIITPKESVEGMLKVISERTEEDSGTFWCWDGRVHPW